ncbi:hypothetical protein [Leifsonia aquatica]|uniref:hypothetical protein n=1 Tax=Leifsonia aquatica TaxID=144185 RepID=UPI0013B47859|nr:hypothetical protein [Leifsonia aquatica]
MTKTISVARCLVSSRIFFGMFSFLLPRSKGNGTKPEMVHLTHWRGVGPAAASAPPPTEPPSF